MLPAGAESSLWRAVAAYRLLVLAYLIVVVLFHWHGYARPWAGWLVLGSLVGWTLVCLRAFPPREPAWPLLLADLAIACAAVALTVVVETAEHIGAGAPTLPTFWASGCVLAWGVRYGAGGGAIAAAAIALANQVVHPAAVAAALDNVARHAGPTARAWVLVEDEAGAVTVTIRDDGAGMPAGRLAAARSEGRLGVAHSIVGRLRALGGDAVVTSAPDQGTEVELRLPAGAG